MKLRSEAVKIERKRWKENFGKWFSEAIEQAEIIDYRYPIKGCGVWLPYGFRLRDNILKIIRQVHDETGHDEMLFPMLIPRDLLAKEAEHIKGFEGETFWVTHGGLRALGTKLALRPTSEAVITPMVKLWAHSHADLPKKLYQIGSIFRYETKATRPLIRVREVTTFKEAHTFHATHEEAEQQVKEAIRIYKLIFDQLRIPYVISRRPDWDKFHGAVYSIAFDTVFPDGKTVQIGTAHDLGQNFSKAFDATFETKDGKQEYFWQTSYGISERIVASVMAIHGDDHGIVLPSIVAPIQVVIVPIPYKGKERKIDEICSEVAETLKKAGIRTEVDFEEITPGEKFYRWERKGVPIRIEIGPEEVKKRIATLVRRDTLGRSVCKLEDIVNVVKRLMNEFDLSLAERSWKWLKEHEHYVLDIEEARKLISERKGIVKILWCGKDSCGLAIQEKVSARVLGIPLDLEEEVIGNCPICREKATMSLRIAKAY